MGAQGPATPSWPPHINLRAGGRSQGDVCALGDTAPSIGPSRRRPVAVAAAMLQTLRQHRGSSCHTGRQV